MGHGVAEAILVTTQCLPLGRKVFNSTLDRKVAGNAKYNFFGGRESWLLMSILAR